MMKRLKNIIYQMLKDISLAVFRFPFTIFCLVAATSLVCYTISLESPASIIIQKSIATLIVGALLGMVAQFLLERFNNSPMMLAVAYGFTIFFTVGYFMILWPAPEFSKEITVRTLVAVFSMICAVLWIPAYQGKSDFNRIALIHFKSFFTSLLYSGVLSGGISAIIFTIHQLLFRINDNSYAYMMAIIWIIFAPIFYLSLLPKFNPKTQEEEDEMIHASNYPRFLEILVSYISIPLFTAYTIVLLAYFMKILITSVWPSGQLGPMVFAYSLIGVLLFILASLPENRFAFLFRIIFPKVWIPVVVMQLVSLWIRLNSYGITESRYYMTLFAIFSIVAGIFLCFCPISKNRLIALLAAGFAIVSIIPPVDAFTISRNSQIGRVETILQSEGILSDGKLNPKSNASENSKLEITNILSYLDQNSSLEYIAWLPEDFNMYQDMKNIFGFEPFYSSSTGTENQYFYASVDSQIPVEISGYDLSTFITSNGENNSKENVITPFSLYGIDYSFCVERLSSEDVRVSIKNTMNHELLGTNIYEFARDIKDTGNSGKDMLPPDRMTFTTTDQGYSMKIIFQNINITYINEKDINVDFTANVLIKVPSMVK